MLLAAKLPEISGFFQSVSEPDNASDGSTPNNLTEQDSGPSTGTAISFADKPEQELELDTDIKKWGIKSWAASSIINKETVCAPADEEHPTGHFPLDR